MEDSDGLCLSCLSQKGSFTNSRLKSFEGINQTYSLSSLASLVHHAQSHGIEIIPEIDVPAHSLSWGYAFPELVINCPVFSSAQQTPGDVFALHPLHPRTLPVIRAVLSQIATIFPSKYLHVGGDEVMTECWMEDQVLVRFDILIFNCVLIRRRRFNQEESVSQMYLLNLKRKFLRLFDHLGRFRSVGKV